MRSGDSNRNAHGCWGHFGLHDLVHVGVLEQNGVMENLSEKEKNSHILPTGQWYAPSAVINYALIMH